RSSEAKRPGRVDAAECEDGDGPVVVDEPGDEEADGLTIAAHFPEGVLELHPAVANHAAGGRYPGPVLPDPKKQRQAEDDEPRGNEQVRRAHVLAVLGGEAEPRRLRLHECDEREREREQTSEVAKAPPESRHASDLALVRDLRQERVV